MDFGQVVADRISALIEERGTNNRAVALAAGMSATGVRDIVTRKTKNPTLANLVKIAEVLDVSIQEIVGDSPQERPTVAIAGAVGAGAMVPVFDAYEKGGGPQVECPPQLSPHGIVAVEIVGDSMEPVYSAGDLLFYTREAADGVPSDAIGHRCVCEDMNGMGWVKQVRAGSEPGLFNLISLNPGADNQHDVKLKWAARVRMHLPADMARRA
ncbi:MULTISPECIES: XRE family transcriptional regulator [unclassified Sulfitobacter]|uniref:XRE family transcriptional regulator n=1 Tax=unclassified Sulfitobacter TaxID=196795 RepID=UPI003747444D